MHTFVGSFIGSPGMNLMPATVDGAVAHVGAHAVNLRAAPKATSGKIELGVRPEYVRIGQVGTPAQITGIEEAGRLRIVRARLEGRHIAAIAPASWEAPAHPYISFDPKGVNLYVDSWRTETGV
jgi:glycerol transport system ATP-binding protein